MGEIELNRSSLELIIHSNIILYGDSATPELTQQFVDEVESMWNEPNGSISYHNEDFRIVFKIVGSHKPGLTELEVLENTNPRNNYFRVEDYSPINISWVDGIGSNTGYMFIENLYLGSTTAAHEYGHTIGLDHPDELNLLGKGIPGIMYPRGTLVDPSFQYDPSKMPGEIGGTMHPKHRKVNREDIELLKLPELLKNEIPYIGKFTSVYHPRIHRPTLV